MEPEVSIIIVNYNGRNHLQQCLSSLQDTLYSNYEVVMVDNNSVDGSVNFVKQNFPYIRIVELSNNLGFAASNNLAARSARGRYYVFLNNDTIVTKDWLTELVKTVSSSSDIAIAQSLLILPDETIDSSGDYVDKIGRPYSSKEENPKDGRPILSARAASMIIKKEIFWQLGGFEEIFFSSFEDVHLGWKAWMRGYKVVLAANSVVYHAAGQTTRRLKSTMNFHSMKNQICIIFLNFETMKIIRNMLLLFAVYFPVFVKRRIHSPNDIDNNTYSNPIYIGDIMRTTWWMIRHIDSLYQKHKTIMKLRVNSTDDLLRMGLITKKMFEK